MAAADRLCAWSDFVAPSCRCHYGGILIALGRWTEAEESCSRRSGRSRAATAPSARPRSSAWPRCGSCRGASRRPSGCSRASTGIRPRGRRWRRSRSRGATSRWRRTSPGCAWRERTLRPRLRAAARAPASPPARARRRRRRASHARAAGGARRRLRQTSASRRSPRSPPAACWRSEGDARRPAHSRGRSRGSRRSSCPWRRRGRGSRWPGRSRRDAAARRSRRPASRSSRSSASGAARDADAAAGLLRMLGAPGRSRPKGRGTADGARGGGSLPPGRGPVERRDRGAPGDQPADRRAPRGEHPRRSSGLRTRAEAAAHALRERPQDT